MLREGREVAILLQQLMIVLDAIGGDDDVGRSPNREAEPPERSIISRASNGELGIEHGDDAVTSSSWRCCAG
jgi:hypothetical protein